MPQPASVPRKGSASITAESEALQCALLSLAWECDFSTFKETFEKADPPHDLEWRGTLPELRVPKPPETPMRAVDIACLRGHWEIAFYLLDRGADWKYANEHGTTLLHLALLSPYLFHRCAFSDQTKIVHRLLENDDIRTIINTRTWDMQLRSRLDFHQPRSWERNGASPIEIALADSPQDKRTPQLLIDKGAIRPGLAHFILKTERPDMQMVRECLKFEKSLMQRVETHLIEDSDENSNTILHTAVSKARFGGEMEMYGLVELMLDMDMRASCKNRWGHTAWDIACTPGRRRPYLLSLLAESEVKHNIGCEDHDGSWYAQGMRIPMIRDTLLQDAQDTKRIVVSLDGGWKGNNMIHVLGSAMQLATLRMHDAAARESRIRIAEAIDKHFVENQGNDDRLASREVGVGVEKLPGIDIRFTSIALPFLWVETTEAKGSMKQRQGPLRSRFCGNSNPSSLRICLSPTLDEHANPGINRRILNRRNKDQVLARYSSRNSMAKMFMSVPQAWIWRIGEDLITTMPLLNPEFRSIIDITLRDYLNVSGLSTDHIIGSLLTELIASLDRPHVAGYHEPILTVFAKEIAAISDKVDEYIRESNISNIKVDTEKGFVHEISDIREELSIINRVLAQQEEIWREFALDAWPDAENWPEGVNGRFILKKDKVSAYNGDGPENMASAEYRNGSPREMSEIRRHIEKPQYVITKFKRRIADLDEDAERTEKSIQIRLDLKQKHLALRETRTVSVMSASVFAFTIITIIFTPLSFATSLFALSVDEFAHHQTTIPDRQDPVYGTSYIVTSLVAVEMSALIITSVAILASLKYFLRMDLKEVIKEIWESFKLERESAIKSEASSVSDQESEQVNEAAASAPTKKPSYSRLHFFGSRGWARGFRRRRDSDKEPGYKITERRSR